jgi:Family of unknown function (DUF6152)
MSRPTIVASILTWAVLGVASSAVAHHPPRFERCKSLTVMGELASVTWSNPHVELSLKAEDGTAYRVVWGWSQPAQGC